MSDTGLRELERRHAATGDLFDFQRLLAADARAKGSAVELRPYQVEAIASVLDAVKAGNTRAIVNLPTGCGKTVTGFALARRMGVRTLWLAHRAELCAQALEACVRVWPEARVGIVKAETDQHQGRDVVIASVATVAREAGNGALPRLERVLASGAFGLVIVDECHHAPAPTWTRVLEVLGCFRRPPSAELPVPLVGLTATVERADDKGLGDVFQAVAFRLGLRAAVDNRFLVPWRSVSVPLPIDPRALEIARNGEFTERSLEAELLRVGAAEATARALEEHARPRKAIVFTVTVRQADMTAAALRARGIPAEALSGGTPDDERRAILGRLSSGATRVVCNAAVLTEGFDEPTVDCVAIARPTRSRPLYVQMAGRGLRLSAGKTDCLLLDFVGASDLGIVSASDLETTAEKAERRQATARFCTCGHGRAAHVPIVDAGGALEGCHVRGCECGAFEAEPAEERTRGPRGACACGHALGAHATDGGACEQTGCGCSLYERGTAEALLVAGFVNEAADARAAAASGLAWVEVCPGAWAIGAGDRGTFVLYEQAAAYGPGVGETDGYELWTVAKDRNQVPKLEGIYRGSVEGVFAELSAWIRDEGLIRLTGASAEWRASDASKGQLDELDRRRISWTKPISKGEAADRITRASIRWRLGSAWPKRTAFKAGGPAR